MKLYYSPGACSLAPHITLQELGLKYDVEKVDLKAHKTESGKDFYAINPKGYVPAIEIDGGELLTEGVAMQLYLAGLKPDNKIAAKPGDKDYLKLIEWLTFVATEFHKGLGAVAWAGLDDAGKAVLRPKVEKRLSYVDQHLAKNQYLLGDRFTVADGYLFTILNWAKPAGIELSKWKNVAAYYARVGARPAVQEAMKAEGLTPPVAKAA